MAAKPRFRVRSSALAVIATAIGFLSWASASLASTGSVYYDSNENVAAGAFLFNGTFTGKANTGLGRWVMQALTTGSANIAIGTDALNYTTTGKHNTATGASALYLNSTGNDNVATGVNALLDSTTGGENTATGSFALEGNTAGYDNVASGYRSLDSNTHGNANVATGAFALQSNHGSNNVATGPRALSLNTTGNRNIALGSGAGKNLTTGSDNIDIASPGFAGESGTIRIGIKGKQTRAFMHGIYGNAIAGKTVVVNQNGRLGTARVASPAQQTRTISRLRARVGKLATEVRQLQQEVRAAG